MKIIKFGGTSIGEALAIKQFCYILRDKKKQDNRYIIIVSAVGGTTNKLIDCTQYIENKNDKYYILIDDIEIKHMEVTLKLFTYIHNNIIFNIIKYINILDLYYNNINYETYLSFISLNKIMNFGELISSFLINEKLKESGLVSISKDSRELIVINNKYQNLKINYTKSVFKIKYFLIKENAPYIIVPGFISSSIKRETSSLGRGGSDYSASILSSSIKTELMEIWTDVNGIMTTNPKIVSKVFTQKKLSYREIIKLSQFGSKIIYPPTILPNMKNKIPIIIKSTFSPLERGTLIFVTYKCKTIVIGITSILDIQKEKELYILAIIVNETKNISMTFSHIFSVLEKENININGIGYNKKIISTIISKKKNKKSIKTLHNIFFEKNHKNIYIFIAGLGKIGTDLVDKINKQKEFLIEELNIKLTIIAICNSNIMYFDFKGINFNNLKFYFKLGIYINIKKFIFNLYNCKLQNKIFIDITDSNKIANIYDDILVKRIGLITCNKIACSSSYQEYKNIKSIAKYFKTPFFFETNVGANIPIISAISFFLQSGDKIHTINSILSGSLNFILNKIKGTFIDNINESKNKGFSEPDIRLDLSGLDVIRKIIILIRECGIFLELEDIKQIPLLPKICLKRSRKKIFYQELNFNEYYFKQLRIIAKEQKKRINYVLKYKYGISFIGLDYIGHIHPFYQINGKENMIFFTTKYSVNRPIFFKGPGAGIKVTSSGIFSDLIKASMCI